MSESAVTQSHDNSAREFLRAVGEGRITEVRQMLAAAPELVHATGPHPFWGGRPQALHVAIETQQRAIFALLLEAGANVNGVNHEYEHWSPLMLAAGKPEFREKLLRRGARIGVAEALLLADDQRLAQLLASGLPAVVPGSGSWLNLARTVFAVDRLLDEGASAAQPDRWGTTPVAALSKLGAAGRALVDHLTARGAAAAPEEYARLGDRATLEALAGADPALAQREEVLFEAVAGGHLDLVDWLLARGASASARTGVRSRQTVLHEAAWNGDLAMVKRLVEAGADVLARDQEHDETPAGWADVAVVVRNNPACAAVAEYLRAREIESGR